MQKKYSSLPNIKNLLLGFFLLLTLQISAQATWQYIDNYDGFYGLYDANHFCIKDGFTAEYTNDGGASFNTLGLPANQLLALQYLSTSEIMALTSAGGSLELFRSTDGGANFNSQGTILDPAFLGLNNREFFFLNANTGFVFNQVMFDGDLFELLLKTSDGGQNWSIVEDTTAFDVAIQMFFDRDGNIFGAAKMQGFGLYVSQDTGKTFTKLSGTIPNITSGLNFAYDGAQTFMINDVIGSGNSCCYISTDNGLSFSAWTASSSGGQALAFNRPSNVLVFGGSDTTSLSTDNGATFNTIRFGNDKPSGSIYFIGSGDDGQSFYLYDGNAKLWVYNSNSVRLNEEAFQSFSIYPNPAKNFLQVETPQGEKLGSTIQVFEPSGRLVLKEKITSQEQMINITNLKPGSYIMKLKHNQHTYLSQHFIKN